VILPITINYGLGNRGFLPIDSADVAYIRVVIVQLLLDWAVMGLPGWQISASLVVLFHLVFRSIFYTHSIERMSSSDESGAELSRPSYVTPPDSEKHIERVLGRRGYREFLTVKHTANL
jgi:hypothetical protein